ncbi:aminotransferase class IV [Aristophania vespae]|uniref:Probable branched-chain-amino-acid aminotransferase n=1 Tax=Aristophania vespae TaxID=2697033 RepID=A0A6P1NCQ2_9PROT|nr:aminotransferase class IV [Aristophania vespae]
MAQGCQILRLPLPDKTLIEQALLQLCEMHQLFNGSARLTVTRGIGPRGLMPPQPAQPTILLVINPLPAHEPAPVKLILSSHKRQRNSVLSHIKSTNTLLSIIARLEAQDHQADDALLLNEQDFIAEATASNFLALRDGQLITPPIEDGALPGISRTRLIEEGLCTESSLTSKELYKLEGAWLVTALSLTNISSINTHKLPLPEELTQSLRRFLY